MGRPALSIQVKQKDQNKLAELLSGGIQQVRVVLRALALRQLAQGVSAPRIATLVPLTAQAIRNLARRYQQGGLDAALYEKQRPGAAQILDGSQKQRVIAMVCSSPPEGRARWTVRLVAQEAVKRGWFPAWDGKPSGFCSSTTTSSRGGKKMWWCAGINRHEVEDERALRERNSEPLGPEFCVECREARSEA